MIPWTAQRELNQRFKCRVDLTLMPLLAAWAVIMWTQHPWMALPPLATLLIVVPLFVYDSRKLTAMMANKPYHGARGLTLWTQHPWCGWGIPERVFRCGGRDADGFMCERTVDLSTATYFPSTQRFAKVCACGHGHFQVPPASARERAANLPVSEEIHDGPEAA